MKHNFLAVCFTLLVSGCFLVPHKIEVQQGNYIDEKMIALLELDMTKEQVSYILGTPLIKDPFHPNRWDYVFLEGEASNVKKQKGISLYFDGDNLSRIDME